MKWKECELCSSYLISDHGDVKHRKTNKIRKQKLDKHGYLEVTLSMGSRQNVTHKLVHRLVAEAFIPNPENKPQVNHINGNKTDNRVENLEWATAKENNNHARQTGLKPNDRGELSSNSKLTYQQVLYCRAVYKPHDKIFGVEALAKQFGISKSTMSYVVNKKTYIGE